MSSERLLSLVIPSYDSNRFPDVKDLIDSIAIQTYSTIEALFATESAEVKSLVERYAKARSEANVSVIYEPRAKGVDGCRNLGITKARGALTAVLDDDVVLAPDWAATVMKTFDEFPNVGAVTGPAIPGWTGAKPDWIPHQLYWLISCTIWEWTRITEIRNVGGMNAAFPTEVLRRVGMYDESIGPVKGGAKAGRILYTGAEEVDLCLRIRRQTGMKILYNPEMVVLHKVKSYQTKMRFLTVRAIHFGYTRRYISRIRFEGGQQNLSFELNQLPKTLLSIVTEARQPRLGLSDHAKRILLYAVSFLSLAVGYVLG